MQNNDESARRVLLVDDDPLVCTLMSQLLAMNDFDVESVHTGEDALTRVREGFRGAVVLDVWLPDSEGPVVFQQLKELAPDLPVIFLTGYGTTDLALESIRDGAFDFLDKANLTERLAPTVGAALEGMALAVGPEGGAEGQDAPFSEIITRSPEMRAVFRQMQNAIDSKVTVLIRGESGTGKELVARAIHVHGPRRDGPFVTINCASIPESLLEAEIFGYERGAFTGASARKLGRFELAHRGTLFLDEIGELQPALQAKLLRVIQERQFQRLGGVETLQADVRILSATNRILEEEVAAGRFREDLYYRLAVFTVHLPPLRQRSGDVPLLVRHFVRQLAEREGKDPNRDVDARAMEILEAYTWPGNVRELENVINFALVSAKGPVLGIGDLPPHFLSAVSLSRAKGNEPAARSTGAAPGQDPAAAAASDGVGTPLSPLPAYTSLDHFPSLAEVERRHIRAALSLAGRNKSKTAQLLGISRTTLYRKLEELEARGEATFHEP